MATYLHAREADAYARLLKERRRRPRAAPSFRFEPRAMPTIEERPVGLPPPGLRYTLYAPRRAEAAVDECAARATAAAAEDAAIRRYLAKQAPEARPRPRAPVPADAAAERKRIDGEARRLHQLMETIDEEHAALARQTFRETVPPGSPPRRLPVAARPPVAHQPGAAPPEIAREGRPAGSKKSQCTGECGVVLFYVLCCPVAMLLHKRHHG